MRNVLQDACLFKFFALFLGDIALNHTEKDVGEALCLRLGLADHKVQHHIRRGLRDRTAVTGKTAVLNHAVNDFEL